MDDEDPGQYVVKLSMYVDESDKTSLDRGCSIFMHEIVVVA